LALTLSQTFLIFEDLHYFKEYWSGICRISVGVCLFFSHKRGAIGLEKKDPTGNMPFSSNHIRGAGCQQDLSLCMMSLITWLRLYLSGFSTIKINCLTFPCILHSLEGSHQTQPRLKRGSYTSPC
jgi:hypothetical protein